MFDIAEMCRSLGSQAEPEPPYQFEIGDLGCLLLEDDGCTARLVLNSQAGPRDIALRAAEQHPAELPVYLSKSSGGSQCYHLVTDAQSDQTKLLLGTLDRLISKKAKNTPNKSPKN